jgi:hypothetical protein
VNWNDFMSLQSMLGLADFYSRRKGVFYPWGFAMNGMTSRLEATRQMIFALGIEQIVETGTYRGTTTEWFAQFGIPIETVEISERFFAFSKARLAGFPHVKLSLNSSVPYLEARIPTAARTLFYLDSHWENYLPLREELRLIFRRYKNAVVLIDDFKVEDDSGYGFDAYSSEKDITLRYISSSDSKNLRFFYPATPSAQETGARRGWIVITSNDLIVRELSRLTLLREYDAVPASAIALDTL